MKLLVRYSTCISASTSLSSLIGLEASMGRSWPWSRRSCPRIARRASLACRHFECKPHITCSVSPSKPPTYREARTCCVQSSYAHWLLFIYRYYSCVYLPTDMARKALEQQSVASFHPMENYMRFVSASMMYSWVVWNFNSTDQLDRKCINLVHIHWDYWMRRYQLLPPCCSRPCIRGCLDDKVARGTFRFHPMTASFINCHSVNGLDNSPKNAP